MAVSPLTIEMHEHSTVPFFKGTIPLPPSVNAAYKIIKVHRSDGSVEGVRFGPTPALETFKEMAHALLSDAKKTCIDWSLVNSLRDAKRRVPYKVVVHAYFKEEWKRDLDGVIKYVLDAAFKKMELDDVQVTTILLVKHVDHANPRVEIEVSVDLSSR